MKSSGGVSTRSPVALAGLLADRLTPLREAMEEELPREGAVQAFGLTRVEPSPWRLDRWVWVGILISLLWKFKFFLLAFQIYRTVPVRDGFFPAALQSPQVFLGLYLLSIGCALGGLLARSVRGRLWAGGVLTSSLLGLCWHQQSYNDVTFLTCWWTAVWAVWFNSRWAKEPAESLQIKAVFLSHVILALIFFGGAVGKLTPGYWSGEVFYGIYFEGRDYWLFNWLRHNFSEGTLRQIACGYSRFVIVMEGITATIWLWPARWASAWVLGILLSVGVFSNFYLFSVLACLIGLAVVGLVPERSFVQATGQ